MTRTHAPLTATPDNHKFRVECDTARRQFRRRVRECNAAAKAAAVAHRGIADAAREAAARHAEAAK